MAPDRLGSAMARGIGKGLRPANTCHVLVDLAMPGHDPFPRRHQPIPGRPATALARKRVVLWYDPSGEWDSEFDDDQPAAAE
jgi:hypothetical protein